MATKKNKKKQTKSKKVVRKKTVPKKIAAKKKTPSKKAAPPKKAARNKNRPQAGSQSVETVAFNPQESKAGRSAGQSGDLQGLSDVAEADSESVDELLEEGNALEAEVVKGVEDAPDADKGEVRTHEVPEDDVPEEYDDEQ
jgi:hypothetical protein